MNIKGDVLQSVSWSECVGRFVVPDGIREISEYAFFACIQMTELVLPEGLEVIHGFAFCKCHFLEKIYFPDSIRVIESNALEDTLWMRNQGGGLVMPTPRCLYKYTSRKLDVIVPDGVEHIAASAFEGTCVRSVKLPKGLKTIGEWAFEDCKNLVSIELPEGLESIGIRCFAGCRALTEIYVPDSVVNVGLGAFLSTPWYQNAGSGCVMLNNKVLLCYNGDEPDVVLPEGIEIIAEGAFGNCAYSLSSLVLPEGVKRISGAFLMTWPSTLERVVIPSTLERWDGIAFWQSHIRRLELNFSVDNSIYEVIESTRLLADCDIDCIYAPYIPISAFEQHKKAAAIGFAEMCAEGREFPKKVAEDYKRYIKCQRLKLYPLFSQNLRLVKFMCDEKMIPLEQIDKAIEYAGDNLEVRARLMDYKNSCFTSSDEEKLMMRELCKDPFSITEMKKTWGYTVNEDDTVTIKSYKGDGGDVVIPSTIGKRKVSAIAAKAFYPYAGMTKQIKNGRDNVKSVKIPDTVTEIGDDAFMVSLSLEQVELGSGVTSIGERAFRYCGKLKSIRIPSSVKKIGKCAFADCHELESVVVEEGVTALGDKSFSLNWSLKSIWLPASLQSFGKGCFSGCSFLVIYAPHNSKAISYAKENNINCIEI